MLAGEVQKPEGESFVGESVELHRVGRSERCGGRVGLIADFDAIHGFWLF